MNIDDLAHLFAPFCGKTLLVGFSGGADSTAALLVTHRFQQRFGFALLAVHMNHHLRGAESDREARDAAGFAAALGVEMVTVDLDIAPGNNLEARARSARLAAWHTLQEQFPEMCVVTGHHRDDRVENLLLRLGRGGNVSALTSLQEHGMVENIPFLRPLISWSRQDIENFLRSSGITAWAQDSSNDELFTQRNILRHKILPEFYRMLPGGEKAVARSLEMLTADAACLDALAEEKFQHGDLSSRAFWLGLPEALRYRVLQKHLQLQPPRQAVEKFNVLLAGGSDGGCEFSPRQSVMMLGEKVCFLLRSEKGAPLPPLEWHWRQNSEIIWGCWRLRAQQVCCHDPAADGGMAWFAADKLPEVLLVRAVGPGDEMVPFGRKNPEKLKKLRVDRGVSAADSPPVLCTAEKVVIWFPQIRHSAHFPAEAGKSAVLVRAEKIN